MGILQWIDTPQGRGGRPSGSPQSTSLSPPVPEEILAFSLFFFSFFKAVWFERCASFKCSFKTTVVRLKSGLKGSASSANQRRGLQLRQTMQVWSRYVKIEITFCLFWSKLHTKLSDQQTMKNKKALFCIMKHLNSNSLCSKPHEALCMSLDFFFFFFYVRERNVQEKNWKHRRFRPISALRETPVPLSDPGSGSPAPTLGGNCPFPKRPAAEPNTSSLSNLSIHQARFSLSNSFRPNGLRSPRRHNKIHSTSTLGKKAV